MAAPPAPPTQQKKLVARSSQPSQGARLLRLYRMTIGKKAVMAVSGIIFVLFLILHMLGNLKIFIGRTDYNNYAAWLRTMGSPALPVNTGLIIIDVILIVCVLLHIGSAVELALRARRARPVEYQGGSAPQSYATRTLRTGAILIVIFIVYHLLDLTSLTINPKGIPGNPYANVVADFQNGWVVAFYTICLIVIGFHIKHGIWSACQTLGWGNGRRERPIKIFATVFSVLLIAGFLMVPFGVLGGLVH
jgi:succinate dehydrogenase / fumarate reductase cytochrome b subunit